MQVQRYTWEDALIEAHTQGRLPNGALLVALKLARAINWCPTDNRPSGLYWKNEDALKSVGSSRASYFKHRGILFELGFFIEVRGNLIPQVPQSLLETDSDTDNLAQSSVETNQSLLETGQSSVETTQSSVDNPYSEDIYSEDSLSDDELSDDKESRLEDDREAGIDSPSNNDSDTAHSSNADEDTRQSLLKTEVEETKHESQCIEPGCTMLKYKTHGLDICHKHYMKQKYPDTKPYVEKVTPKTDLELAVW